MDTFYSKKLLRINLLGHLFLCFLFYNPTDSGAVQLTHDNIDNILATNELVLINFYADWCRFSNLLQPIWDEAATKIAAEFPTAGQVLVGKVDCDKENTVAERYHITKYPTLKVIRNGSPAKREYRGQRSAEAFLTFVKQQLENPIKEFFSLQEMNAFDTKKRIIIGFFDTKDVPEYDVFRRVATNLKEDCTFYVGFGEPVRTMHPPGTPIIAFRPDHATPDSENESYQGSLKNYDELNAWMTDKCVPLVREITFENAEELTEEGLPFLILFHKPDDLQTVKQFKEIVVNELLSEKQNVNFLTADGEKFAHPLHHLGKSQSDLPLIAIDSFRHMYMFPDASHMTIPGKLKTFIQDLYSGKLHREYHYGPDPPTEDVLQIDGKSGPTTPPESTFKKLAPSDKRYTLLQKDEL